MDTPAQSNKDEDLGAGWGFRAVLLGGAAAVVAAVVALRFGGPLTEDLLPRKPPPPPRPTAQDIRDTDYSPGIFQAYVKEDAARLAVTAPSIEDLSMPLAPYQVSDAQRFLAVGDPPLEAASLRLALRVETRDATTAGGTFSAEHLILTIENLAAQPVAYVVVTAPEASAERCLMKSDLPHNAIALAAHEKLARSECLYRKGMRLRVDRVETLGLSEFSYHYVTRLDPQHIGLDPRATRGHNQPTCEGIDAQAIRNALDRKQATWRDIIDFYARHRCETYQFPSGYHAFASQGEWTLPVSAAMARQPR